MYHSNIIIHLSNITKFIYSLADMKIVCAYE